MDITPTPQKKEVPQLFRQDAFDFANADAATALIESFKRAPNYIIFPSHLDKRFIQKMIITLNHYSFKPGKDGSPNRYIVFPAYSCGIYFDRKTLYYGCPFVAMFPAQSFYDMFYRSAGITLERVLQEYHKKGELPLMEIHFKKNSERDYELLYFSLVEHVKTDQTQEGKQDTFKLIRLLFESKKYAPKSKPHKQQV